MNATLQSTAQATIGELIEMEASLEFMALDYTREDHITCYKLAYREQAGRAWDAARDLVREYKTVRKSLNHVRREIDKHR
jgi:hypothetical protein